MEPLNLMDQFSYLQKLGANRTCAVRSSNCSLHIILPEWMESIIYSLTRVCITRVWITMICIIFQFPNQTGPKIDVERLNFGLENYSGLVTFSMFPIVRYGCELWSNIQSGKLVR